MQAQEPLPHGSPSGRTRGRTGLIVCGGASRRMGHDKARLEIGGRTLLERAVATLDALCDEVLLATGAGPRYLDLGRSVVLDRTGGLGPLAGLEAGLAAAPDGWVVCLPCDMPGIGAQTLAHLVEEAEGSGHDAVLLVSADGLQPLCGVYHTRLAACARAALDAGQRKVTALFDEPLDDGRTPRCLGVDERSLGATGAARNVNTCEDLDAARRAAREVVA